jgi:hypothetical protein
MADVTDDAAAKFSPLNGHTSTMKPLFLASLTVWLLLISSPESGPSSRLRIRILNM